MVIYSVFCSLFTIYHAKKEYKQHQKNYKFVICCKQKNHSTMPFSIPHGKKKRSPHKNQRRIARPKRRNGSTKSSSRLEKFLESLVLLGIKCLGTEKKTHLLGILELASTYRLGFE